MGRIRRGLRNSLLDYWYFHLPNFVLAALMYTLLGRALLGLMVRSQFANYIWRFFCRVTDPVVAAVTPVTRRRPHRSWCGCSASSGCSGCASACSICFLCSARCRSWARAHGPQFLLSSASPSSAWSTGCSTRRAAVRADPTCRSSRRAPVRQRSLTLMFSSLMVSTATVILGGVPAALYEHFVGPKDDSTAFRCGYGSPGVEFFCLPAIGNFLQIGL